MKARSVLAGCLFVWAAFLFAGRFKNPVEPSLCAGMEGKTGITVISNIYACGHESNENRKAVGKVWKNNTFLYLREKTSFGNIFID